MIENKKMDKYEHRRQRLIELRDKFCDGRISALAEKLGRSSSYVSRMLYQEGHPHKKRIGDDMLDIIASAFGVSKAWIDGDHELDNNVRELGIPLNTVPIVSWVTAGHWAQAIDLLQPGEGERISTSIKVRPHTYALIVDGDSMEPEFTDGDIIIVEPEEEPVPGKFVIIRQNGDEATFKQLISDGGRWLLKPLNPRYPVMEMRDDAVFCGVVKEKIKRY